MLNSHFFFSFSILSHQCCQCLNNSHHVFSRPVDLTVREGQSQVCVHVPPTLVQKILLNTLPDKLNKTVGETFKNPKKQTYHFLFLHFLLLLQHLFHVRGVYVLSLII